MEARLRRGVALTAGKTSFWRAAALVVGLLLCLAPTARALELEIVDQDGTPRRFSAHQPQQLCFLVTINTMGYAPVVFVTFEGPSGELGGKPALADSQTPVCFSAPALSDAGSWKSCNPPRDKISEAYLLRAELDETGAASDEGREGRSVDGTSFVWKVERLVTEKEPKPEECTDLDGNWTWTFNTGVLECAKLPMKVSLPGFSESVVVETDGASDTEGLRMTVTGSKTRERLVLIREADATKKGKSYPAFAGGQDLSKLLDQRNGPRGKYSLVVTSPDRMEGQLDVNKARYQGDICSIFWPFFAVRKSDS